MKTLNTVLASVLSYALILTPAFGQSEDERSADSEAPRATAPAEESRTTDAQPEATPDTTEQPSDAATDQAKPEKTEKKRKKKVVDEPGAPSRGTGKIVGGIVTASVGAGIGLLTLAYLLVDCNDIDKDDVDSGEADKQEDREKDIKRCNQLQKDAKVNGSLLTVAALGVGLPLLYFGIQDRKIYNEWKAGQPSQDESVYAPGKASLVFIPSGNTVSPGINVTYKF